MERSFTFTVIAALAVNVIGSAYAANTTENDALAISGAKIGLSQAVTAAELHVSGKASRAEYEKYKGQQVFDVEVIKDRKVMDVKVAAANGSVISAVEDKTGHDDSHDKTD